MAQGVSILWYTRVPMDPEVIYVLRAAGHLLSTHVMCRSTLSTGMGVYEEVLTADVADILRLFKPYDKFLKHRASSSRVSLDVIEFSKHQERKIGADFAIMLRGLVDDGQTRRFIRKFVLVQAKRQAKSSFMYAASNNHVHKAQTMIKAAGTADAFFAFYHNHDLLKRNPAASQWLGGLAPMFGFATPYQWNGYFYPQGALSAQMGETFLEMSAYSSVDKGMRKQRRVQDEAEWGIAMLPAAHILSAASQAQSKALPPVATVLQYGYSFPTFLEKLVTCQLGTNRANDRELRDLQQLLASGTLGEGEGEFAPMFTIFIQFASGTGTDGWDFHSDAEMIRDNAEPPTSDT